MLGLSSLLFVRDYLYGIQSQQNSSFLDQERDEQGGPSFLGSNESYKSRYGKQFQYGTSTEETFKNSASLVTPDPRLTENCTSTTASLIRTTLDPKERPFRSHKELAPNDDLPHALREQPESPYPTKHELRFNSSPVVQPRRIAHPTKPRQLRGQEIKSTDLKSLSKGQLLPRRQVSPFVPVIRNRGRAPNQVAQSASKVRRLSPLRESSGITDRNAEPEQQILVVQKTRRPHKPVLRTSEPSHKLCQSAVPDLTFRSLLLPRLSVSEDYCNSKVFLGRHRTLSSEELCGSASHSRPISRTTSGSSLRYLPPEKGKHLYIGVDAHKILLPSNPHRLSNPIVTYRQSPQKERQIPTMTPYAIFPTRDTENFGFMSPTRLVPAGSIFATNSISNRHRSSSDVSTAGSNSSNVKTIARKAETFQPGNVDPDADQRRGQFFGDLTIEIHQRVEAEQAGFPAGMGPMMSSFQASFSNSDEIQISPHAENTGTYFTFSDTLSTLKVVSVNTETSFLDEVVEDISFSHGQAGKRIKFMPELADGWSKIRISYSTAECEDYMLIRPVSTDAHSVGYSTPSGNHSTIDSKSLDQENFWFKLRALFAGCLSTR